MVKEVQRKMSLIGTTLLCIHLCVKTEGLIYPLKSKPSMWNALRRLLNDEDSGAPRNATIPSTITTTSNPKTMKELSTTLQFTDMTHADADHTKFTTMELIKKKDEELTSINEKRNIKLTSGRHSAKISDTKSTPKENNKTKRASRFKVEKPFSSSKPSHKNHTKRAKTTTVTHSNKRKKYLRIRNENKGMPRAKLYRKDSKESLERLRRSTLRITKMHPRDDEMPSTSMFPDINSHLNPYATNEQMLKFIEKTKDKMNITMEKMARTAEYNDIILLKITELSSANYRANDDKYSNEPPAKPIIFIVHGLSVLGMAGLIRDESTFDTLMSFYARHLKRFDLFVIPIANPDGYAAVLNLRYGKFWNKNLSRQRSCSGVALDRNFDVEFNTSQGISSCSQLYPGPQPFSEPETRAIREIFHLYQRQIVSYIHVHASTFSESIFKGDAILYPRGYTNEPLDDDKYIDLKGEIDDYFLKNGSFKVISVAVEPLYLWYGKVLGTSVDYASTVYGIPYAMEFAMQSYDGMEALALHEIWGRIIDVVFNNIWRNTIENGQFLLK